MRLSCLAPRGITTEVDDVNGILHAITGDLLKVTMNSPAELIVRDPLGRVVSSSEFEIWGANYRQIFDSTGHKQDIVEIPFPVSGNYEIHAIPDADADPNATFTITMEQGGIESVVVHNMPVSAVGNAPFVLDVPPANQRPIANAGFGRVARQGSTVQLNGSQSADLDMEPEPLHFMWIQLAGSEQLDIRDGATATPSFLPRLAGTYTFGLTVADGLLTSWSSSVSVHVPQLGDIDNDGDVDADDKRQIIDRLNTTANGANDLLDLNGDGRITGLDVSELVQRCTRKACSIQ